eukprot:CAMPEP_0173404162 /NCGR_PEP_ID=MMETSP1356-20130122/58661_1 /TAXON_ID=77927 ORGANISM="Hemiselmis virescens, Strain PCC157" /NCGR_SAMPLE_ID=MMETSP1356 /ASSEMBLY_ACC=CAM_ASM_000847 /LENGTH=133 /DNA_ID=CAMNT_0014364797 /DNA_START=213 /DNA_END=611 /DNA_ORIENTATION=-
MKGACVWILAALVLTLPLSAGKQNQDKANSSTVVVVGGGSRMESIPPQDADYAVVIEAGSNSTVVHVYEYTWQTGHTYPQVTLPGKQLRVDHALSQYAGSPGDIGKIVDPLIRFAGSAVPQDRQSATPVVMTA